MGDVLAALVTRYCMVENVNNGEVRTSKDFFIVTWKYSSLENFTLLVKNEMGFSFSTAITSPIIACNSLADANFMVCETEQDPTAESISVFILKLNTEVSALSIVKFGPDPEWYPMGGQVGWDARSK